MTLREYILKLAKESALPTTKPKIKPPKEKPKIKRPLTPPKTAPKPAPKAEGMIDKIAQRYKNLKENGGN